MIMEGYNIQQNWFFDLKGMSWEEIRAIHAGMSIHQENLRSLLNRTKKPSSEQYAELERVSRIVERLETGFIKELWQ